MNRDLRIVDALIEGDHDMHHLYQHSPEFRTGLDLIARTLPRFVQLMAEEARTAERFRSAVVEGIERRPGPGERR